MAKKDSINLTVEEQLVIQDRLGQIWKNAPYRKVASLIAEIHLAVWPKAAFGDFEWGAFSDVRPLKKAKPLVLSVEPEADAEEAEEPTVEEESDE